MRPSDGAAPGGAPRVLLSPWARGNSLAAHAQRDQPSRPGGKGTVCCRKGNAQASFDPLLQVQS